MYPLLKQAWAMSAVLFNILGQGMMLSLPSAILPALLDSNSTIKFDLQSGSSFASLVGVSMIPGFLMSWIVMEIYGRRLAHVIFILFGVMGLLLTYFAKDITALMVGRFMGGFSSGATVSLGAIAIGEYTSPNYRGVFLCLKNTSVCIGSTLVHSMCNFVHWRTIVLISLIPHIVAVVINLTWPESPSWLVSKERYKECEESFYKIRGINEESSRELKAMIKAQVKRLSKPLTQLTPKQKMVGYIMKFTENNFIKPLLIMIFAFVILEASGRHIFPAYAIQIVSTLTGNKLQTFYCTLGIDLIILTSSLFSSFLVKIINRRTLLFYTGFGACFVLLIVCSYLALVSKGMLTNNSAVFPSSLFALFFILVNLGCIPISLILIGEIFPLAHRGAGTALAGVWMSICMMAGLKATPHLLESIHIYGTFMAYGLFMFLCLLMLFFMLPETKNRTLQQIENYLNYGKYDNVEYNDNEESLRSMINE